ncbi:kelch repeat-containing protein [soil metagenome]
MRSPRSSLSFFALFLVACGSSASTPAVTADAGTDVAADAPEVLPTAIVTSTGSLEQARANHTATLLAGGRVLVVGGEDIASRTPMASVEVWDPKTGQFSQLPDLPTAVVGHTATLLQDGRVLVTGGGRYGASGIPTGEGVTDVAYTIDPTTGVATATAPMKHKRSQHFAVALGDGTVLIGGGADAVVKDPPPALASAEIFDPKTGQFTDEATLLEGREMAQAVALDGDRVMVVSGINPLKGDLASTEIYDHKTHAFTAGPALVDGGRIYHSVLHATDGRVLVLGGVQPGSGGATFLDSVEVYEGNAFQLGPLLDKGRNSAPLVESSGRVFAFGGYAYEIGLSAYFDEVLYLGKDGWHTIGNLKYGSFGHTATPLADGRVLVVGGSNAKLLARAELVSFQ